MRKKCKNKIKIWKLFWLVILLSHTVIFRFSQRSVVNIILDKRQHCDIFLYVDPDSRATWHSIILLYTWYIPYHLKNI